MTRRTVIKAIVLAPLLLASLVAMLVSVALFTERGGERVVSLAQRFSDGTLTVRAASGYLGQRFVLEGIVLNTAGARVAIETFAVTWRRSRLLQGELLISELAVRTLDVEVLPTPAAPSAEAPALPAAPIALRISGADVDGIHVHGSAGPLDLAHLGFALDWRGRRLHIDTFTVAGEPGRVAGALQAEQKAGGLEIELGVDATLAAGERQVGVALDAAGPLNALAISARVDSEYVAELTGTLNALAPAGQISVTVEPLVIGPADGDHTRVAASTITLDGDLRKLDLALATTVSHASFPPRRLQLTGSADSPTTLAEQVALEFNWRAGAVDVDAPTWAGRGTLSYDGAAVKLDHTSAAPFASILSLGVRDPAGRAALDVDFLLDQWRVTLAPEQVLELKRLTVNGAGTPQAMKLNADAELTAPTVGAAIVALRAAVSDKAVTIERLDAQVLDGKVELDGEVALKPALAASGRFQARDLDFAALRADLKSRLALAGSFDASQRNERTSSNIVLESIGGQWRGHALRGRARIAASPDEITINQARLALGSNHATANVTLGQKLAGNFDLEFNDFSLFADSLDGALAARGRIGGSRRAPVVRATLSGSKIRQGDFSLATVEGDVDLNLADAVASRIELKATGLAWQEQDIGALTLNGAGAPERHVLDVDLAGALANVQLAVAGGYTDARWQGLLNAFSSSEQRAGTWSIDGAVPVSVAANAITLGNTCLRQGAAAVCLKTVAASAAGGTVELELSSLPLTLANDYLPSTVRLAGTLDAGAKLRHAEGHWQGVADLVSNGGMIDYKIGDNAPEQLPVKVFVARLTAGADDVKLEAEGEIARWFRFFADVEAGLDPGAGIAGTLEVRAADISWIGEFEPAVAGSEGGAVLALGLAGTRAAPRFDLEFGLDDGHVLLPDLGIDITTLDLNARGTHGGRVDLGARLASGSGDINLNGHVLAVAEAHWPGSITIKGKDFGVLRREEGEADISPDLSIDFSTQRVDIRGAVTIPRVSVVQPPAAAGTVAVSSDEVIVGGSSQADNSEDQPGNDFVVDNVTADVDLILGDHVNIDAAGLTAALSGQLHWQKKAGELLGRGDGRLQVAGEYQAYNQHLEISRGDLIFAGPIDNPSIDIRAARPDLPVTAGVSATGSIRDPRIGLYSQPTMSDSDILAYLITGRPLGDASSGEAGIIAQAALGLGAEKSTAITSRIQSAFGLDEFSVQAGSTARSSSLVAGKRLSPKVAVRADFNPFDRLWTLFLNYKLTDNISVEAESGESQGADLLYSIERRRVLGSD